MPARKVMIIRHAERPSDGSPDLGVNLDGSKNPNALTVTGWQRAGALVRFFAPDVGVPTVGIERPTALFAAKPDVKHISDRTRLTLGPLACELKLSVNADFSRDQEPDLAAAVRQIQGVVLIAWEHKAIHKVVANLTQDAVQVPVWPDPRFDMVYVLTFEPKPTMTQVPQNLLAGDQSQEF